MAWGTDVTEAKAVIFDLDDTLVVELASAEGAFLATCERARKRYGIDPAMLHESVRRRARELWHASPERDYCLEIGISSWEGMWGDFGGDGPSLKALREWTPAYRREAWARALADRGVREGAFAEELAELFPVERRKLHVAFPDAEPVLKRLRGEFRLALLSNGAPRIQREKLEGSGLEGYFDAIVISGELGVGKPDPRIYHRTVEQIGVAPQEAVMVGNSLEKDFLGARRAGLRALWLNRDGEPCPEQVQPDAVIESLAKIPDLL
ncbi:MAG TPA: HAD family hydrolase [Sumerlaeia bacterium]|nr:HAD family hydrolase [Sumerlaeia bacterium]